MKKGKKIINYLSCHGLGFRTLKTALAISLILLVAYLFDYPDAYYICSVALLTIQITPKESLRLGAQRLVGTAIGGGLGTLMLYVSIYSNIHVYILAVFSLILGIFISNLIKMKGASAICALVIMLILIVPLDTKPYLYALKRTLETTIGIVVAVLINFSFKRKTKLEPYNTDKNDEKK
jgi:uncharacterized membrane protein YgaE (UPF0421/DUF939 family)